MAIAAANRSSSFIGVTLLTIQRNPRTKGAGGLKNNDPQEG